jgi:hypothetical protein
MARFVLVGPPLAALNPARRKRRPYIEQKLSAPRDEDFRKKRLH